MVEPGKQSGCSGKIGQAMKAKDQGKARYYPPEIMPSSYCAACLDVVLEQDEEARRLYDEIMECYKLPGCVEMFSKLEDDIPEGEPLMKKIVNKAGFEYDKPPKRENMGIPFMRGLIKGWWGLASDYEKGRGCAGV